MIGQYIIDRQRAVPAKLRTDRRDLLAHVGINSALLDRLAAPDASGDPQIAMKAEQLAMAKHGLRFPDRTCDKILHQHLIGEPALRAQAHHADILRNAFEIAGSMREPDATAGGAHRGLDNSGKSHGGAKLIFRVDDLRWRLRQAEPIQQAAEAGLAVHHAVTFEAWQREPNVAGQALA